MNKKLSYVGFWLIQCTWGIVMTFIGAVAALTLIVLGYKPQKFGPVVYFEVGKNWGGVSLGGFFFCNERPSKSLKTHEFGHSIQNIVFGPLMPFLVSIPSATRYWLYHIKSYEKKTMYSAAIFVVSALVFTLFAWLMTFTHIKMLVIAFEVLRLYSIGLSLWLRLCQIPQFKDGKKPGYYAVWFEAQANALGKIFEKKEA